MLNQQSKVLIYITGPIGAGKSTFTSLLLPYIKNSISEYINADIYYHKVFNSIENPQIRRECAKTLCKYKLNKSIHENKSIIWEDVICKESKIDILRSYYKNGYYIIGIFLSMDSKNELVHRSKKRSEEGWYKVPEEKIKKKYDQLVKCFNGLRLYSDEFYGIDTFSQNYELVFCEVNNKIIEMHNCKWLINNLAGKY